jgi:hypothetical protein
MLGRIKEKNSGVPHVTLRQGPREDRHHDSCPAWPADTNKGVG